jgi:hypothetical protein
LRQATALVPIPTGRWIKRSTAATIYGGDAGVLGLPTVLDGQSAQSMTFMPFTFALYWRDPHCMKGRSALCTVIDEQTSREIQWRAVLWPCTGCSLRRRLRLLMPRG